jgi:hypothetical protein
MATNCGRKPTQKWSSDKRTDETVFASAGDGLPDRQIYRRFSAKEKGGTYQLV